MSYKCYNNKCINQIELGFWCNDCTRGLLEDMKCMKIPPSFFYRLYDFISTKIDNFMFKLEHIHDRKIVRKMIKDIIRK